MQWNISHENEQNNAICSDMDEPRDCHTKQSKSENFLQTISIASEVRLSNLTTKELQLYNKDSTKLMDKGANAKIFAT